MSGYIIETNKWLAGSLYCGYIAREGGEKARAGEIDSLSRLQVTCNQEQPRAHMKDSAKHDDLTRLQRERCCLAGAAASPALALL